MRKLSPQFMDDLSSGILTTIRDRVLADRSLCLEIRENYVNIYYRGGNLLKLSQAPSGYSAFFDPEYAEEKDRDNLRDALPPKVITNDAEVAGWIAMIPTLKQYMDLYLGRHPKEEREAQQQILRDNNFGGVSRATDYYICDIEYANSNGRFDLVAVHWPSESAVRKQAYDRRLVLIEVKFGDTALKGTAGISEHINGINNFLEDAGNLATLKEEMVAVFNQKRALGLIDCGKDLAAFSDEPPILMLLLVNHDPDSSNLRTVLKDLPPCRHAELYIATGCFMGYGLFDPAIHSLGVAQGRFQDCI